MPQEATAPSPSSRPGRAGSAAVGPNVPELALLLDGAHHELRQRIRDLLSRPSFAYRSELGRAEYRDLVMRWLRVLAREGLGLVGYPKEVGGGGDVTGGVAVFEQVAFHDLSLLVKFGVQFGLFGGTIARLGTERHHRRYLHRVGTLEIPGCFAMTETGHGSNVRDIRTTARFDPDGGEFVVHTPDDSACKDFIGNAAVHGRMAVVFAQLEVGGRDHGVHALLVPIRTRGGRTARGVRIEDCGEKLGLNGVDNGRTRFDRVRVPRENLLNRFADVDGEGTYSSPIRDPSRRFFTMVGALVQGRVSIATASVSAAKSALAIAVRYGPRRRQFGPPGRPELLILDYATHQRRLMPALATTYALDFAAKHLVSEFARSLEGERVAARRRRRIEGLAAGLKAYASWHCTETVQTCREACGGQGYLAENRLAALKADTEVFTTFEGDNTVLMQLVAKGLLTDYRHEFEDLDVPAMLRLVARRVLGTIAEAVPVVPSTVVPGVVALVARQGGDEESLRRREEQLAMFRFREAHMLEGLAGRLKKAIDAGEDPFVASIAAQDHMVATARAHIETVVLERFAAAIARVRAPDVAGPLDLLCDLYALSRIERDRGWFLEHGRLSPARSKAVIKLVSQLCREVREVAGGLVDAFSIPDALLAAPIARR